MSRDRFHIRRLMAYILLGTAGVLMGLALLLDRSHRDPSSAADEFSRAVGKRISLMDSFLDQAAEEDDASWLSLELPEDMVLYRYLDDTLQCWINQFPLLSDDIRPRTVVQRLGDGRSALTSPLSEVGEGLSFVNYGPKWFLVKSRMSGNARLVAGLEIADDLKAGSVNGVNPRLSLDEGYSLQPLSSGIGVPVMLEGEPLMKLVPEQVIESGRYHPLPFWLSVLAALGGLLLLLASWPGWGRFCLSVLCQGGLLAGVYFYGRHLAHGSQLFSPLLYADGPFFYSLGAGLLVNLGILCFVSSLFIMKGTLLKAIRRRSSTALKVSVIILAALAAVGICAYIHIAFKSILLNSGICLELYKINLLNQYSAIVYLSFLSLALTIPMLADIAAPVLRSLNGMRFDAFSGRSRTVFSILAGAYFVIASALMGYRKEGSSVEVWANRLAMDRDLSLELQLRAVEPQVASDPVIRALTQLEDGTHLIRARLVSSSMGRISQDYDISVLLLGTDELSTGILDERIRSGVRLWDGSHFFYSLSSAGQARYTGFFTYLDPAAGPSSILVLVESKHNREDRGYLSLMGVTEPGRVSIPPRYSYAKYVDGRIVSNKGEYAYPTVLDGQLPQRDGYVHFVEQVSSSEVVIISRSETPPLFFVVEGVVFALLTFLLISLLTRRRRKDSSPRYFQNRISLVLYLSLSFTLIGMAAFSVWFVYRRNAADMRGIMNARINIIQSMAQSMLRDIDRTRPVMDAMDAVDRIGNTLHTDLSVFSASGVLISSTTPEVYERMFLGHRVDDRAYKLLVYDHQRFAILREKVGRRRFYNLHAPVFGPSGEIVAIVSSPYTGRSVALETDTILHVATILTAFILLLLLSRYVTMAIISRMFRPISEISDKMKVTDVDHLDELEYDRDDELKPLVESYNRMVRDLSESTRRLAQVERDKAWNDMARRVAHDIKNPLTPIKLKLQMLIRLKQSGNEKWVDKFDEVCATVLEHVDMLADSADQFSTFAKLYDQSPEPLDLDELVRQEVALYDTREDVSLEYIGFSGAMVSGPKPQLIRVIVNLLTNAMQAVDELGGRKSIAVSLRNSTVDGFYDLVVEDNGPGVSEEIRERIFTPDFTTKSSGSGLGLAICQKIVEHCGGEIFYARSFTLGGASFTVRYPKL